MSALISQAVQLTGIIEPDVLLTGQFSSAGANLTGTIQGAPGPAGPQGEQGLQGEPGPQGPAVTVDNAVNTTSTNPVQNQAVANYIASRGENLITNGTALLGNNYNFSSLEFDGADSFYAGGCFKKMGRDFTFINNELIPIDVNQEYELSYYIKTTSADALYYDFIACYDIDKKLIYPDYCNYVKNTLTTLARDLNPGDTIIYLDSTANFSDVIYGHNTTLIFWDYVNSYGYLYEPETYSRNLLPRRSWTENSAIDKTNNTISLTIPYSGPFRAAGTFVSQGYVGGETYNHINSGYKIDGNTWVKKTGRTKGVGDVYDRCRVRKGTAFIRIGMIFNYGNCGGSNTVTKISTITFAVCPPQKTATSDIIGSIKVGNNLSITADGTLSVDTANVVEQDNTKPITSAAVHTEIGNIEALLAAL